MAINLNDVYPDNSEPSDLDYPLGSARNSTTETAKDGFGLEKRWVNEFIGFLQAIRNNKTFVPSGTPDTARLSQYFNSLMSTDVNIGRLAEGFADLGDGSTITIGNDASYKALLSWASLLMKKTPGDDFALNTAITGSGITFGGNFSNGPGDATVQHRESEFSVADTTDVTIVDHIITFPFTSGGDLVLTGIPWDTKIHRASFRANTATGKVSGDLNCSYLDASGVVSIGGASGVSHLTSLLGLPMTDVKFVITYDPSLVD